MHDAVRTAYGVPDRRRVEEVELLMPGHHELVARGLRAGPQRTAEDAGAAGDEEPQA